MGKKKELTGTVISDKMAKTVIVRVMHLSKHPKYQRIAKRYSKFKAHDENKSAKVGDTVSIEACRPLSKDKHFRVVGVVKKATAPNIELKEEI
ncbi:MAG TPA: 30S ribosomal protein S17 [Candidatus Margulisiibacteriota bacterium]|nr:30S ribosomal protein S17 [Candidatus Margulisiibacteriota bacterium]